MSLCNVTILEGGECVKGFPTHEVRKNPISMSTDESIVTILEGGEFV